jgi:hypothetical protein
MVIEIWRGSSGMKDKEHKENENWYKRMLPSVSAFSLPQFARQDGERWLLMAVVKGGGGERREVTGEDGVIWWEL